MANQFDKIAMPMIRKAFPQISINDIVGVQPMFTNSEPSSSASLADLEPLPTAEDFNKIKESLGEIYE